MIGKIIEKEILKRTKPILNTCIQQSPLQFGFTEKKSSTNRAFVITEAIAEAKDNKDTLYVTFMDVKRAFDTVWHEAMLVSLHNHGVTGQYVFRYKVTSKTKWPIVQSYRRKARYKARGINLSRHL